MAEITASLVKELRERTGAGMMECKKALVEANGDIELAIDNMRKSGQAKAAKKAGRVAAEGVIVARVGAGFGVLVEMNCETDFVAKDAGFLGLANEVVDFAAANKGTTIDALKAQFEEKRAALVAKIGVLVAGEGSEDELKKVAMHVAASKPEFVNPEDVSADVVEHERQIQIDIAINSGKPKEIAEKMVEGRMKKFTGEVSLTGQAFVMDPSQSVGDYLKSVNTKVSNFIRLEVGEGIEKVEEDFAAEVAKITGGNA